MTIHTEAAVPVVELRNVSKWYGPTKVIDDLSLAAYAGRVLVILGDNGAGKSTLIKILSGVEKISAGSYLFKGDGVDIKNARHGRELGIATVFQDLAIAPMLSITRNIVLGNEPTKGWGPFRWFDAATARRQAKESLAALGVKISRDETELAARLSGGEKQALAIARAVYYGASCLMLDEPTSALAVRQSGKVLESIATARDKGQAVIVITHNFQHALDIADEIIVLRHGSVVGRMAPQDTDISAITHLVSGT